MPTGCLRGASTTGDGSVVAGIADSLAGNLADTGAFLLRWWPVPLLAAALPAAVRLRPQPRRGRRKGPRPAPQGVTAPMLLVGASAVWTGGLSLSRRAITGCRCW